MLNAATAAATLLGAFAVGRIVRRVATGRLIVIVLFWFVLC